MKVLNDAEESEIFVATFSTELPKSFMRERSPLAIVRRRYSASLNSLKEMDSLAFA
jgi:hypothetical protein